MCLEASIFHKHENDIWNGACLDTGAQSTVVSVRQAEAYCQFMGTKFKPSKSEHKFHFGIDLQQSMGSINIRLPMLDVVVISEEEVDVVNANAPFLLELVVLINIRG